MTRINTNVSALIAQKNLADANDPTANRSDPFEHRFADQHRCRQSGRFDRRRSARSPISPACNAGINNSQLANSVISTADSGLSQVQQLLNTIQGLVNQSANTGALSTDQIAANQLQVDSSLQAIDTIANTTTFHGRTLLDGSLSFINTSAGTATTAATGTLGPRPPPRPPATYGTGNIGFKLTAVDRGSRGQQLQDSVAAHGIGTTTPVQH